MSTLFLINSCQAGGSELKTLRMANELSRHDLPVTIAYLNSPDPPDGMLLQGVKSIPLLRTGKLDFRTVETIRNLVRRNKVNTLFCINLYPSLYGFLAKLFGSDGGLKTYSMINKTDFDRSADILQMLLYAPILRSFSGLIFGCKAQQAKWISRYRFAPGKCTHIYNGVDCDHFTPLTSPQERLQLRTKFGFGEEMVLVCVAGLRPVKRHIDLIEACRVLHLHGQKVRVVLAGDGPEKDRLLNATQNAGLADHVLFLGRLQDVRPVLAAADVFVLCSASETFSNAALEAMAMGRPVVLSNTGGAPEMVEDGQNGHLYQPGHVQELVSKLLLLSCPKQRTEVGACARRLVQERFNYETMVRSYLQLIKQDR
jgi:glycosyltransferase involved in cell wall biosynthesis